MSELYTGTITARNGTEVPVFAGGRTFFSSYNPDRDADNFVTAHKDAFAGAGCILIGGIGNGLHIIKLSEAFPEARIIAFETDESSLQFALHHIPSSLSEETRRTGSRIILTSAEQLRTVLLSHYLPSIHGNFAFAAVRSWADAIGGKTASYVSLINETIADISADYSVQAQFGKLWHKNILTNLSLYDSLAPSLRFNAAHFHSDARKAAIIGAGPSLDETIRILAENRSEYCIFATDTVFSSLKAASITPDFVVTVDSQLISGQHFTGQSFEGTVLATDLTGNSSIIKHALSQNANILFFCNNHPLSQLVGSWLTDICKLKSPFPVIDSGAGTVLHAAADLSRKLGFTELCFFGADFAYSGGKPYTKGTYLEKRYYTEEDRTGNAETAYSRLMYRTPLSLLPDGSATTEVLSRYKKTLESYLQESCTCLLTNSSDDEISENRNHSPKLSDFIPWYLEKLQKKDEKVLFSLLPLAAWYKKNFPDADTECVYAYAVEQTAHVGRIQCRLQKK